MHMLPDLVSDACAQKTSHMGGFATRRPLQTPLCEVDAPKQGMATVKRTWKPIQTFTEAAVQSCLQITGDCAAYRIAQLCLIDMLLFKQFCASLLDQVRRVEMHFALLSKPDELIFELVAPVVAKHTVYDRIALDATSAVTTSIYNEARRLRKL